MFILSVRTSGVFIAGDLRINAQLVHDASTADCTLRSTLFS